MKILQVHELSMDAFKAEIAEIVEAFKSNRQRCLTLEPPQSAPPDPAVVEVVISAA